MNKADRLIEAGFGPMCGVHQNKFVAELVSTVLISEELSRELWNGFVEEEETKLQEKLALPLARAIKAQRLAS